MEALIPEAGCYTVHISFNYLRCAFCQLPWRRMTHWKFSCALLHKTMSSPGKRKRDRSPRSHSNAQKKIVFLVKSWLNGLCLVAEVGGNGRGSIRRIWSNDAHKCFEVQRAANWNSLQGGAKSKQLSRIIILKLAMAWCFINFDYKMSTRIW